jgi:hypothetical protein
MRSFNDLYSSLNIVRVIKSRRMRWAGHVARVGERRGVYRVLMGKPEEKRPEVNWRIIVRYNSGSEM